MKLADTIGLIISEHFDDRLLGEYYENHVRIEGLAKMLEDYKAGRLSFTPKCPIELLEKQLGHMKEYQLDLIERLNIELGRVPTEDQVKGYNECLVVGSIDWLKLRDMLNLVNEKEYAFYIDDNDYHDYAPDTIVYDILCRDVDGVAITKEGKVVYTSDGEMFDVECYASEKEAFEAIKQNPDVKFAYWNEKQGTGVGFNKTEKQIKYEIDWVDSGKTFDDESFDESNLE